MPLFNLAGKYTNILQGARDFVLDRFTPRPEALFIKAMTGGAPTQTTMTETELGKIKDAYRTQKLRELPTPQQAFEQANKQYTDYVNSDEYFGQPLVPPTFEAIEQMYSKAKAEQQSPVTSLYGHGRDMAMAYGNLSVYPQPDGGVRIYDRWKVDKDVMRRPDEADRVGDLMEGGPIASLVYSAADKLGTYRPFDIDVTVPGEEWQKIKPIGINLPASNINSPAQFSQYLDKQAQENQGGLLYFLNNLYTDSKVNPQKYGR